MEVYVRKESANSGMTMPELLVVMMIVATSLSLAAPTMRDALFRNTARTEANRLLSGINFTRSEAVRLNSPVSMCPAQVGDEGSLSCGGLYSGGWLVFSNPDRDRDITLGSGQLLMVAGALPSGYTITNRTGTRHASQLITYLPDGSSRRNRTLSVCPPQSAPRRSISIVMNIVGRPRVAYDWGTCPEN